MSVVAQDQYHAITGAADAWLVAADEGDGEDSELMTTNSARRIKSLVEQVTGEAFLTCSLKFMLIERLCTS